MNVEHILTGAQDALQARRVFGDPVQIDGITVIPAAVVGGGGGGGAKPGDEGSGVGFGVSARPAGVFVVRDGDARWRPAVDVNRVVLGGQVVAIAAILTLGPTLLRWLTRGRSAAP
jgi:uncharacterized spore protein YtfJ